MKFQFLRPKMLYLIIPLIAVLFFLIRKSFVRFNLDSEGRRRMRKKRVWVFLLRSAAIILLVLALARPFVEVPIEEAGNPEVTLLVDESESMDVMNDSFKESFVESVQRRIPLTERSIASGNSSFLGDGVLKFLSPNANVLLLTDGNNFGTKLSDTALHATNMNATISSLTLKPSVKEAGVEVTGPKNVISGAEETYKVGINSNYGEEVRLKVELDGETIFDGKTREGFTFTRSFNQGYHKIKAKVFTEDRFSQNNEFYKVVNVLKKPKILLLSESGNPLQKVLEDLYTVERRKRLPSQLSDLQKYYTVVVNDMPVERVRKFNMLHKYLMDEEHNYYGNGLVVMGGFDSFDRGSYKGSSFEELLPVRVGEGKREKGKANLVFVIDVSGGVGGTRYVKEGDKMVKVEDEVPTIDIIRAQVKNAIETLKLDNRVGVIAFGLSTEGKTGASAEETLSESVKILEKPDFLYNNRKSVIDKVSRIKGGGPTTPDIALRTAVDMLKRSSGDRNIIFLTDGRFSAGIGSGQDTAVKNQVLNIVSNAKTMGVKTMTVGVGSSDDSVFSRKVDEPFLKTTAAAGESTYDRATQLKSLLVKWGEPEMKEFGDPFTLVPLSYTHFITKKFIDNSVTLNAYNKVVPKRSSNLLMTTDFGEPALTTWHYGNGRVAAFTAFSGGSFGPLLAKNNSVLISRMVNWAVGDPRRKEDFSVSVPDARVGKRTEAEIVSEETLSTSLDLEKREDKYLYRFTPQTVGFKELLGVPYAVNYKREFQEIGMNPELNSTVQKTEGKRFKPGEVNKIVEFAKQISRRKRVTQKLLKWPFIIAAIVLLLVDVGIRRVFELKKRG